MVRPPTTTPWAGIISLAGMAVCLVASAVVIGISHDNPVAWWRVQPAVLLAIFSGASSILFSSALDTGIAVRFWLSASRGTQLSELHYIWDHGRGFGLIPALRAGSRARTVALLATAAYLIQFLAGPLLQRATFQVVREDVTQDVLSMDIATRVPDGWFGDRGANGAGIREWRHGLAQLREWSRREPILTHDKPGYACSGLCNGYVWGAGFSYDCWKAEEKLDMSTNKTDDSTVFMIDLWVTENVTSQAFLQLTTVHLSEVDKNCIGTVRSETCYLTAATVEYPVIVQNSTVSLRTSELSGMRSRMEYWSAGDAMNTTKGTPGGPLRSLRSLVNNALSDNATKFYDDELDRSTYAGPGGSGDIFYVPSTENPDPSPPRCRLKFAEPTEYALNVMHEFMFRFAMAAGDGTAETQIFEVARSARTLVFQVDPAYLAASVAALACGIALVSALMWKWWLLGRPVTLSPLETAAALGRPILQHQPHATIGEILAETRGLGSRTGTNLTVEAITVEPDEKGNVVEKRAMAPEIRKL